MQKLRVFTPVRCIIRFPICFKVEMKFIRPWTHHLVIDLRQDCGDCAVWDHVHIDQWCVFNRTSNQLVIGDRPDILDQLVPNGVSSLIGIQASLQQFTLHSSPYWAGRKSFPGMLVTLETDININLLHTGIVQKPTNEGCKKWYFVSWLFAHPWS